MTINSLPSWARWLLAVAALFVAVSLFVSTPRAETLRCARGPDGYACTHALEFPLQTPRIREFSDERVGSIEFREYTTGKNGRTKKGATDVFDIKGKPLKIFGDAREIARERHARIMAFVAGEGPDELQIIKRPSVVQRLLLPLGMLGFAVAMVVSALRSRPVASATSEAATGGSSKSLGSLGSVLASPLARRVLLLIIAALAIGFAAPRVMGYLGGHVEIRCEHRCKVGGGECMPGGVMTMWQPPGSFSVEVFDPDAPGQWTPISIEVKKGGQHVLVCKPGSTSSGD